MNSSFLFLFLLKVEGLTLFLSFLVAGVFFPLVSREKVKEELMVRVKENSLPWLVSAWQRSRHCLAKVGSPSITTGAVISDPFF